MEKSICSKVFSGTFPIVAKCKALDSILTLQKKKKKIPNVKLKSKAG
jgi:hypothetical protein